jgi:hypothetical protein
MFEVSHLPHLSQPLDDYSCCGGCLVSTCCSGRRTGKGYRVVGSRVQVEETKVDDGNEEKQVPLHLTMDELI